MEPVNVTNMAEFKRLLKMGGITHLKGEYHSFCGGSSENNPTHKFFAVRKVGTVQTNSFTRVQDDGQESWCSYPPAKLTTFAGNIMTFPIDNDKAVDASNKMAYSCWKE